MLDKVGSALLAVVVGVAGAVILFWILNKIAELLPGKWESRIKPYTFLAPALAAIALMLIYPVILTINYSFLNASGTAAVGFKNYVEIFQDPDFVTSLINNLLWIVFVPAIVVGLGLMVAILADRLSSTKEKIAKSLIFLPMAISMVGASVIWTLIYSYVPWDPKNQVPQIGLLNEIVLKLGGTPQSWLQISTGRLNTFMLMIVYIWLQVGYAMVLLSAAIKAVPDDTIEAGRIDGASEAKIFFRIIVPQAWPTVITVFITVLIGVMKVFDIIFVMTNGQFHSDVIGNYFYQQMFTNMDQGKASAVVVILMIAIIPVMVYQVRQFRMQEENAQ